MIVQAICNSFKQELCVAGHDITSDTFMLALFRRAADIVGVFNASTTNYSEMGADEVTGDGYTAGGNVLAGATIQLVDGVVIIDFDDTAFTDASFTASGALIYNATKDGKALAVWDFGADRRVALNTFTVQMPVAVPATALLRLS